MSFFSWSSVILDTIDRTELSIIPCSKFSQILDLAISNSEIFWSPFLATLRFMIALTFSMGLKSGLLECHWITLRFKRKCVNEPIYVDTLWFPATSNICERFFSEVRHTFPECWSASYPQSMEEVMFVKMNQNL